jgi:D-alanyl-D-alanine dipeptidase
VSETFVIEPLHPLDELFGMAREAEPPEEPGPFREPDFVRVSDVDPRIRMDLRYASSDNFLGAQIYREEEALLQRPAAEALRLVQDDLEARGLGLVVYDAYRPWWVTWLFWEATPPEYRTFVATPSLGSRHNRGCAVDVGLVDLASGTPLPMPSGYDEFTERAYADWNGGPADRRANRQLLISTMRGRSFEVYRAEWWHFDFADWPRYAIENRDFAELVRPG